MDILPQLTRLLFLCLLLAQSILSYGRIAEDVCESVPDGRSIPFPYSCSMFIQCYQRIPFIRNCGANLHFNRIANVCDYPQAAGCSLGWALPRFPDDSEPRAPIRQSHSEYRPGGLPHQPRRPAQQTYQTQKPIRQTYGTTKSNPAPYQPPAKGNFLEKTVPEPVEERPPGYDTEILSRPELSEIRPEPHVRYQETVYGTRKPERQTYDQGIRGYLWTAMKEAMRIIKERLKNEAGMVKRMLGIVDSSVFRYVSAFLDAKPYAKYISYSGNSLLEVMKLMKTKYRMKGKDFRSMVDDVTGVKLLKAMTTPVRPDSKMPVPNSFDFCPYPKIYTCDVHSKYRSLDGSCNNLQDPIWGRCMVPFRRIIPASYNDDIEEMRRSVTGEALPSARTVSLSLFLDRDQPNTLHTMLLVSWGQFIDHDITHTAITEMTKDEAGFGETDEVKCGMDGCQKGQPGLEGCWPISVPKDDPDFPYNRCLKFVRSQEVPHITCSLGPREQLNQVTSWIDGSMIYGSRLEEAKGLREKNPRRGRMAMTNHPRGRVHKPLLPQDNVDLCRDVNATIKCFKSGDVRVNENTGLAVIHTILVREHNRIEEQLHRLNPHWDGEKIYQETRRIVVATVQHVVYNEQLPGILGHEMMDKYGLELVRHGYFEGYDSRIDPRAINSFGAAAYRFGHTLIQDKLPRINSRYEEHDMLFLSRAFRRPVAVYDTKRGGVDGIIRGLAEYPCQTYDRFFTKQVSKSLFTENPPHGPGSDLMSLNIQRARDHGIPSYNEYRVYCGLGRARSFEDLAREIPNPEARQTLKKIYKYVDDIDLFAAGVSEKSVKGGVVGPTFACIIAEQFRALRKGDRFWYENRHEAGFTPAQLEEIRKTTLARMICANSDNVDYIQPSVFWRTPSGPPDRSKHKPPKVNKVAGKPKFKSADDLIKGRSNEKVSCDSLPDLDLTKWKSGPYTS